MNIGIVGLGLIGGSLGLKLQNLNHCVYGITNNSSNEEKAKKRNLASHVSCDFTILKKCSLIILALPIKDLIKPQQELIKSIPSNAVITDVGSVKQPIIETWEKLHPLFIGSHPMAGTENSGVNSGFAKLFDNAKWVITPTKNTDPYSTKLLSTIITSLNCDIYKTTPKEHDEAVALISHLPIFLGSCLIESVNTQENSSLLNTSKVLASTGFYDTSRVGGGNPSLGLDLAISNQKNILKSLKKLSNNINEIEKIIKQKDWDLLFQKLSRAEQIRKQFCD